MNMRDLIDLIVLQEKARDASLFHGVGGANALSILRNDAIEARSKQFDRGQKPFLRAVVDPDEGGHKTISGVSLTRSSAVAFSFGDFVFELEARRIAQRQRIEPIDYWGHSYEAGIRTDFRRQGKHAEAEEFAIGPIAPLSKYLLSILVRQKTFDRASKIESMAPLASHPKLVIVGNDGRPIKRPAV